MSVNKGNQEIDFLKVYTLAHNNAVELLSEAELLYERHHYARAYFLAFTGLEEISKSQLAADVFTDYITMDYFYKHYRDHKGKIGRVIWASEDATHYRDPETDAYLTIVIPDAAKRMSALYVDVGHMITSPAQSVSSDDAKSLIHTLRVAIQKVIEITEYYGQQIGTKGFMK